MTSAHFQTAVIGAAIAALAPAARAFEPALTIPSSLTRDAFGMRVLAVGDLNADGHDDIVVTAPNDRTQAGQQGRCDVFLGGPQPDATPDLVLRGEPSGIFGRTATGGLDFNGDGYPDLAVGNPFYDDGDCNQAGRVYLFHGGPAFDNVWDFTLTGDWAERHLGSGLAPAGLFDEDQYEDLAVGMDPPYGFGPQPAILVFSGGPFADGVKDWGRSVGPHAAAWALGFAYAGDTNGDGYGDLVGGDPTRAGLCIPPILGCGVAGYAELLLGGPNRLAAGHQISASMDDGRLGESTAGLGDVNGDGLDDYLIDAPMADQSWVRFGRANPPSSVATADFVLSPAFEGVGAGDLNGDGYADVAVVDWSSNTKVYFGGSPMDVQPDATLRPAGVLDGWRVAAGPAGDFDGDGRSDLLIGVPSPYTGAPERGWVSVYSGASFGGGVASPVAPARSRIVGVSPNPFNGTAEIKFTLATPGDVRVGIYDSSGRLVRSLVGPAMPAGPGQLLWDGRDESRAPVASGTYRIVFRSRAGSGSTAVALIK